MCIRDSPCNSPIHAAKMMHPLEAFGYYLQLYSPPFVFSMPMSSFVAYMVICGACGVLDHSGVAFSVPGLYDTAGEDKGRGTSDKFGAFWGGRNAEKQQSTSMRGMLHGAQKPADVMLP